ncbi:MAG: hypothetical protein WBN40_12890 [Pseudomonadales bacterium]
MSVQLGAAILFAVVLVLGLFAYALSKQFSKNKALEINVDILDRQIQVLQDSQLGLGKHLLALERRLHEAARSAPGVDAAVAAGGEGSLNRIAALLRAGRDRADVVAELGVSEGEVQLVEMILRNTSGSTQS